MSSHKRCTASIMATCVLISVLAFRPANAVPYEATILKRERDAEVARVDQRYIEALQQLKSKFTKAGKLQDATDVQKILDGAKVTARNLQASGFTSARELLLTMKWRVSGEATYEVRFNEDGTATRLHDNKRIWKWKIIDENSLRCTWFTSGWVKFDLSDLGASSFPGVSRGGTKVRMMAFE